MPNLFFEFLDDMHREEQAVTNAVLVAAVGAFLAVPYLVAAVEADEQEEESEEGEESEEEEDQEDVENEEPPLRLAVAPEP